MTLRILQRRVWENEMLEIPEITFSRMLDEMPTAMKPLFFAKEWEVYCVRKPFEFDGFSFREGMVLEFVGDSIVSVFDDGDIFLAHLRECEVDLPIELRLAMSMDTRAIESALSKRNDATE